MTDDRYTEQTVQLVAEAAFVNLRFARAVLTALADAGLLVLPGDDHLQYGKRWSNGLIMPTSFGETHCRGVGPWRPISEGDAG